MQNSASPAPVLNLFVSTTSHAGWELKIGLIGINRPHRAAFYIAAQFNYHHIQYRLEQDVFGAALFVSEYVWRRFSNIRK